MIEYKLKLAGCECSIVEWNPQAKTIVFVFHGWLDNLASFETIAQYSPNLRLIAVDFPGHGHSDHIEAGLAYHFIDGVYLVDDLIEHFQLDQVNLMGHSMGGAVAMIYAAVQPQRVKRLLLLESIGPLTSSVNSVQSSLDKSICKRRLLKKKQKRIYSNFEDALNTRAEASEISPQYIKPLVERALMVVEGGFIWRADPRLRIPSGFRMSEEQLHRLLPNIKASTLLIEADKGLIQFISKEALEQRKKLINNIECHKLSGSHHLHLESPQKVAQLVVDFIKKM